MRLKPDLLENALKKHLAPVYLLSGDEPLQLNEAADAIRAVANRQGYTERKVFHVDHSFAWGDLMLEANSLSLFAEKKILELRFSSTKLGDAGSKGIMAYCERISSDNILLLIMPKLDKRSQSLKWFKALEQVGVVIQVWPVTENYLAQWIVRRMKTRGLSASKEAVVLLAEKTEGNLLALAQEIEKLSLSGAGTIDREAILAAAGEDAKYDVYKLVDAAIAGKYQRVAKILMALKASGEVPSLILWAFTREIRALVAISCEIEQGVAAYTVFSKHRVWDNRAALVKSALARHKSNQWLELLNRAIDVDQVIKGLRCGNVWDELLDLGFLMSGKELLGNKS